MSGQGSEVTLVHRAGAVVIALVIAAFGVLGLVGGLGFFDTRGATVVGLSTNGALSTVSLVTALVLLAAAARGGRSVSTVMVVVGALFLVSAFVNLWLIGTPHNLLAFRLPNVFFSIAAGLVLLLLGAYGRFTGRPPADNPYRAEGDPSQVAATPPGTVLRATTRVEEETDVALADAARAIATGTASDDQQRRFAVADEARTQEDRRAAWRSADRARESS